jgi:Mrp family chromosome partitioning ATPase
MGKVYEALNRAQDQEGDFDLFDEVEEEQEVSAEQEPTPEKFNFMRYSLGRTSLVAKERIGRSRPAAALMARPPALPGREFTISAERIDPHLVAFNSRDPHAVQQYNKLALTLISRAAERGLKRVLVASAQQGEGRTCVTLNLACALARARQRVLVVDCDLLNPSVMRALGLHSDLGMQEAFERELPPGAAAVSIRPYGFNVLPATRPVDNPALMFAAPRFWKMLQAFDANHDFILFDSSPLSTGGELSLLVRYTHTTLLVIRAGQTSSSEMAKAITPFSQDDILGVVLNRARV